jgi:cyanophycinase-like exopeptidase
MLRFVLIISTLFCLFSNLALPATGVVVIAGGGPEGEIAEKDAWSYQLYKRLIDNGSIHDNKKIKAVIVSLDVPSTPFIANYFLEMGATSTHNITVDSMAAANDPKLLSDLADADVVFFRGGNQGEAYQYWKDTLLHQHVNKIAELGGAIGGTSSGSMSLSEFSMTGGKDYSSSDLLKNAHSLLLNDKVNSNNSGIHNDFLNILPGVIVDTHCAERARLGRLLVVHAKASEDYERKDIVAICLEEKTGLAISNGKAEIYGTGIAHFIQQTPETFLKREKDKPLVYTNVRDDALTEKWIYDLNTRAPIESSAPKSTYQIMKPVDCGAVLKGGKVIQKNDKHNFEYSVNSESKKFKLKQFSNAIVKNVVAIYNGHSEKFRGENQTNALRALYDLPYSSVLLLPEKTEILTTKNSDYVIFNNSLKKSTEVSTLIFDCANCSHKSLSSYTSNQDSGLNDLYSAGFVNLRLHAVADGYGYNVRNHKIQKSRNENALVENICENQNLDSISSSLDNLLPAVKHIEICNR